MSRLLKAPAKIGREGCTACGGRGTLLNPRDEGPPAFQLCRCTLEGAILGNVERGMKGLSGYPPVRETPLSEITGQDTWITSHKGTFLAHLRHVALRKPPNWSFCVVTDAQLMTAWLATAALNGGQIFDADAVKVSLTHATLVDLVGPPTLLIIRLGVKAARNVAMPEVLLEALAHRDHIDEPTWLWDEPHHPLDGGNHLSYSDQVAAFLTDWPRLHLERMEEIKAKRDPASRGSRGSTEPGKRATFSQPTGGTLAEKPPRRKKNFKNGGNNR